MNRCWVGVFDLHSRLFIFLPKQSGKGQTVGPGRDLPTVHEMRTAHDRQHQKSTRRVVNLQCSKQSHRFGIEHEPASLANGTGPEHCFVVSLKFNLIRRFA